MGCIVLYLITTLSENITKVHKKKSNKNFMQRRLGEWERYGRGGKRLRGEGRGEGKEK